MRYRVIVVVVIVILFLLLDVTIAVRNPSNIEYGIRASDVRIKAPSTGSVDRQHVLHSFEAYKDNVSLDTYEQLGIAMLEYANNDTAAISDQINAWKRIAATVWTQLETDQLDPRPDRKHLDEARASYTIDFANSNRWKTPQGVHLSMARHIYWRNLASEPETN